MFVPFSAIIKFLSRTPNYPGSYTWGYAYPRLGITGLHYYALYNKIHSLNYSPNVVTVSMHHNNAKFVFITGVMMNIQVLCDMISYRLAIFTVRANILPILFNVRTVHYYT
jgi:hypothetical protein